ncbi:MAG: hypothetical protein EHM23_12835 [Acidobacteria bacterium]|nr:MAG: hypothetical protein EHM23_12835 [Acidobacteriota bacterium]
MNQVLAALANGLVLGGLLTIAVALLLRILPKQALNAATRYLVWWVTLALVIASPLFYLTDASAPSKLPDLPTQAEAKAHSPAMARPDALRESPPAPSPLADRSSSVFLADKDDRPAAGAAFPIRLTVGALPQLLFLTLAFSSGLMAARMAVSSLVLEHRKRRASPAPADLQRRAQEWLSACGSRRQHVRLLSCSDISIPMAVGPHRPAILIPARLFERFTDRELENIGLHEAAHLARWDDYGLFVQRVIEALFVWNPLVRWITRKIELEREMACDDLVVSITREPREYATCLTNMAEWSWTGRRSLVASGATERGKLLRRRVESLLDKSRQRAANVLRLRAAPLIAAQLMIAFSVTAVPRMVTFAESSGQAAGNEIEKTIAAQAIRLDTVEAGHGFADMQPLKKVIGDARIVALGEATHGTREFFQLKHRMLEFLATEMGFTIFSIEANMPEAYRLNDYVLNGRGDPKQLLKGMYFWTWDTEEVLNMILWMREFNKSGKGRLEFTGFDMQTPNVALEIVDGFVARNDPQYFGDVRTASSLVKSATKQQTAAGRGFGVATGGFPVEKAAGKRVRFSGYIKTADMTRGFAGLWWRVDGKDGQVLAFDNMQDRGVTGTTDWTRYEIELPVAADAVNINFGALHTGDGAAWFDGLKVELDGEPYVNETRFDFEFETAVTTGFYTGGEGYKVSPDKQTFHSGGQSLQMRYVGGPDNRGTDEGPATRAAWKKVLEHLEQGIPEYEKKGISRQESQWALQNARVVMQCLQMVGNEVTRDESMAANVKWILDQSPGAKIVLWAHNLHVARGGLGFHPMGSFLSKMYGDQMVVFGFAFNQGSFQAIGKKLENFTVPPAPRGSLDATLAATGIPILALDLRQAPSGSPLEKWLGQFHDTRSIGAVYKDESAGSFFANLAVRNCFDAILFVEKTTAARPNAMGEAPIFVPVARAGKSEGQDYLDEEMGVSFTLPLAWGIQRAFRWGDRETTAWLNGPDPKGVTALYFKRYAAKALDPSPEAIVQRLRAEVEPKAAQRVSQGMSDYRINMETLRARKVGGRIALSCRGEYTDKGQPMGEYLTWVGSENTTALFFGRAPAAGFDRFCEQFDAVIETLKIP